MPTPPKHIRIARQIVMELADEGAPQVALDVKACAAWAMGKHWDHIERAKLDWLKECGVKGSSQ